MPTAAPSADTTGSRGAKAYFVASTVAQISALVRYTIMSRLLGPEQLGLAATIILTGLFFDQVSDTAADRFIVQDKDGDRPEVVNLVHLVLVARGVVSALCLVALAIPFAIFYKAPTLAMGIMVLAISPFVNGLQHLDMKRVQRQHDFMPESIGIFAAEIATTVVTGVLAYLTHNYMAAVFGLITRTTITVLVSHICAKRPYGLAYSRDYVKQISRFSLPLMLNGLLLFFGSQGDRLLVGYTLGPAGLGHYSAVLLLVYYPTAVLFKFMMSTHLPRVAIGQLDKIKGDKAIEFLAGQTMALTIPIMVGFAVVAPIAIKTLFGARYLLPGLTIGLIGVMQAYRFARNVWPTTEALGFGRSGIVLAGNFIRLLAMPISLTLFYTGFGMDGVVVGFIVGELLSFLIQIVVLNLAGGGAPSHNLSRVALSVGFAIAIGLGEKVAAAPSLPSLAAVGALALILIAYFLVREATAIKATVQAGLDFAMPKFINARKASA